MKPKLNAKEKLLYKEIQNILWETWDPIGVNDGENEWDDEYDSYVPHIFRLAIEGKDVIHIASSFSSSKEQNMGLSANKEHDLNVAEIIIKTKKEIVG